MAEKLRVAMLGAYPLDATKISGGVQAAYSYLVKGLSQTQSIDLHILTIRPSGYAGADQVKQQNLTVHFLPRYPRFERLRNYQNYQSIINAHLAKIYPDLIHAQDAGSDALVALRSGYPTVITIHGIRREDGKHYSSWTKKLRVYFDSFLTERYVVRHARHIIAISPYVTSYFKNILRPDVKVYFIPNAVDERFFIRAGFPDKHIILFAGRVIPRKRVMDLVQAFAQTLNQDPTAQLHIAGEISTEPAYVNLIKKWVREHDLDDHVRFLGPLSEMSVLQEFSNSSIVALPSAQETAPMVVAQAMAAGKPVVATCIGGVSEMVGEDSARGLLVNVGNIPDLTAALTRLLRNPGLQEKMGQNGRAFATENYDIGRVARHTIEVYHRIVFGEYKVNA
jgi:glycosyltransferase involved in cell wall biosynthesis